MFVLGCEEYHAELGSMDELKRESELHIGNFAQK